MTSALQAVGLFAQEFCTARHPEGAPQLERLHMAAGHAQTRQVWILRAGSCDYALKLDLDSPRTGRLAAEFRTLERLHPMFADAPGLKVIRPVYLSPGGAFMVTRRAGGQTAAALLKTATPGEAAPVFARAGRWLRHLHRTDDPSHPPLALASPLPSPLPSVSPFWPRWIFRRLDRLGGTAAAPVAEYRPMIAELRRMAAPLRGTMARSAMCHGDFHGDNLILDGPDTIGLDMTEARRKLAVYDIVDFLKAEAALDLDPGPIGPGGVSQRLQGAFLRAYGPAVDPGLLTVVLRARLLIDWLAITPADRARTAHQAAKYRHLRQRLKGAFSGDGRA